MCVVIVALIVVIVIIITIITIYLFFCSTRCTLDSSGFNQNYPEKKILSGMA